MNLSSIKDPGCLVVPVTSQKGLIVFGRHATREPIGSFARERFASSLLYVPPLTTPLV
jgi:hypothetical protein